MKKDLSSKPGGGTAGAAPRKAAASPLRKLTVPHWARSRLGKTARANYDALNKAVALHQERVLFTGSLEDVNLALTALNMDHPEYFWYKALGARIIASTPLAEKSELKLTYTMPRSQAAAVQNRVDAYVSRVLARVKHARNEYEKILGVYRYIIENTDYVRSVKDQSFLSVMLHRKGTCVGYARCFQYLMYRLNIPCVLALGKGTGGRARGEGHAWNVVRCEGHWYHVDVTWGDPVDAAGKPGDHVTYTYCLVTDREVFKTHTPNRDIPLPVCNHTRYNYYRQRGLQMAQWDKMIYARLMSRAVARKEEWFTVRFDRKKDYAAARAYLIDKSGIFDILRHCGVKPPQKGATYSGYDPLYEFSVKISY